MDQALELRGKTTQLNFAWMALLMLLLVWAAHRYIDDPVTAASVVLFIGLLPLILANRLLLVFFTIFSFYAAQTLIPECITFFGTIRWFFLGTCVVMGMARPAILSSKALPFLKTWKESRWVWVFSGFALLSVFYSVSPSLTILRFIPLVSIFFVISRLVKPLAASYGADKIVNLMLYSALPLYVASLFTLGGKWGWIIPDDPTYKGLEAQKAYSQALGITQGPGLTRFHGVFQNPNNIGLLTGLLFPLALVNLMREKKKTVSVLLVSSMLICLIFSASREGFLTCIISGVYVLNRMHGTKKTFKFALGFMLPVLLILSPLLLVVSRSGWISSYLRLGANFMLGGGRIEAWLIAFQIILLRPFLGYGFGTEDRLFSKFGVRFLYHEGQYAHNSYIGLLMQVGLVGTLLLFVPLFALLISELLAERPSFTRIALQGMLLSALVGCMTESWLYSMGNSQAIAFWIGVGLLEYLRDSERKSAAVESAP